MYVQGDTNLHTHTYRCGHGTGDIRDYIEEGMKSNVKVLGFSEHTPLPDGWWQEIRMSEEAMYEYVHCIDVAKKKYREIVLYKGIECDFFEEYRSYFAHLKKTYELDYLIGSVHAYMLSGKKTILYEQEMTHLNMKAYVQQVLQAMNSHLFDFIAHPDLFCLQLKSWDSYISDCSREIFKEAERLQIPLEINVAGYSKKGISDLSYPAYQFWRLASEYNILTLVNSDAHHPADLTKNLNEGYILQNRYQLRNWIFKREKPACRKRE